MIRLKELSDPTKYLQELPLAVVILTVGRGRQFRAQITTVSYATLEPLRLLKTFSPTSTTLNSLQEVGRFALSIASFENLELVERLSKNELSEEEVKDFASTCPNFSSVNASCYLSDALFALDCRVEKTVIEDDYVIVVSRVEDFQKGSGKTPLIRFRHSYGSIGDTISANDNYPI